MVRYIAKLDPGKVLFIGDPNSPVLRALESKIEVVTVPYHEIPDPGNVEPFLALQREEIYPLGMRYRLVVVEYSESLDADKLLWTLYYTLAFRGMIIVIQGTRTNEFRGFLDRLVGDRYRIQENRGYCIVLVPTRERIAVATDDGENIPMKMLGRAAKYLIYEMKDDGLELVEVRINPYKDTLQRRKTLDVYDVLRDCPVIISAFVGKRGTERLRLRNVKMFFRKGSISKALEEFMADHGTN